MDKPVLHYLVKYEPEQKQLRITLANGSAEDTWFCGPSQPTARDVFSGVYWLHKKLEYTAGTEAEIGQVTFNGKRLDEFAPALHSQENS